MPYRRAIAPALPAAPADPPPPTATDIPSIRRRLRAYADANYGPLGWTYCAVVVQVRGESAAQVVSVDNQRPADPTDN